MDLSKAMRNLQEAKRDNSKEIAKVAKSLKENKSLEEGIIDDLQKGKPTEKRDGSKSEIDKAVKEDKELDAVNKNRGIGMMSDEDQEKYYYDTYKDTNGTFYDVYKMDGKLYDVLGNEVEEKTEAKLNEDQYEAERRKGRPNIKELASQIFEDEAESWKDEAVNANDEADFINKTVAEIASENNLRDNAAKQVCSIIYKKAISSISKNEKKLTELRHVDKKKIVKAYNFSELDSGIQKKLINEWFKYSARRDQVNRDMSPKDMVKQDINEQFINELKETTIFSLNSIYDRLYNDDETIKNILEYTYFDTKIKLNQLSSELTWDNERNNEDTTIDVSGSVKGWSSIGNKILESLSRYTNYDELPKATKKEIISKIKTEMDKVEPLLVTYKEKMKKALEEVDNTNTDFEAIKNKPAVEDLSKYWYTEDGIKIISKDKAKVVEGEVNEALITEAPVNLEMDYGYDVYSYDDLDDYAKRNAFSSTERSRKNEYEKTFNVLRDRIIEMTTEEVNKVGLKLDSNMDEPIQVRSWNKGQIDSIYVYLDPDSLIEYAKSNGIELKEGEGRKPRALLSIGPDREIFEINLNNINVVADENAYQGYREDETVRKALRQELELDLKGLLRKIIRIEKQFKDAIDDDFRNKLSTDKKLKRREYDSKGNIYRDKKNEK